MAEQKSKRIKPIVGGILSGGLSSRMGKQKDLVLLSDGRPMIQHVLDVLLSVCNEVVVSGPEIPLQLKEDERVHFVKDNFQGLGPLGGIEAILSTGISRGYLIAACDQPLLKEEMLRSVIPDDRDVASFFDEDGFVQPFPGYFPVTCLPDVRDALKKNKCAMKSMISEIDVILKHLDPTLKKYLRSINTSDELNSLLRGDFDHDEKSESKANLKHDHSSCRIRGHNH